MQDLISRQAAIDALNKECETIDLALESQTLMYEIRERLHQRRGQNREDVEAIKALSSSQPERKKYDFEKQIHAMFDHIWDTEIEHPVFQDTVGDLMQAVIQVYYNSAEPERKKGKWIYDSESYPLGNPAGHYNCDQCGESVSCKSNYCPNCGADMRGKDE